MSTAVPPAVQAYFDALMAHDWDGLRASLADDFDRLGPFAEHVFPEPDGYVTFLAGLMPTLEAHTLTIDRSLAAGDRCYVEITERLVLDDTPLVSRLCLAIDLAPDGRLRHIEAYLRRTA